MIHFTSDWHINHANIIKYCNRPFKNVKEMNKTIISRCNERVKENDTLFFLGDFGLKSGTGRGEGEPEKLKKYINQIKCKNIIYLEGNHDVKGRNGLKTIIKKVIIHYGGKNMCLIHDPELCDAHYEINLTGHVHEKWKIKRFKKNNSFTDCINVGVDQWDFYPVTWNDINKAYMTWLKSEGMKNV